MTTIEYNALRLRSERGEAESGREKLIHFDTFIELIQKNSKPENKYYKFGVYGNEKDEINKYVKTNIFKGNIYNALLCLYKAQPEFIKHQYSATFFILNDTEDDEELDKEREKHGYVPENPERILTALIDDLIHGDSFWIDEFTKHK